jgi:trigger factor
MEVTQTATDGLKQEFKVVLSASDIEREIDQRLNEIGKEAHVPGFRPGKAPLAILKRRYGDSVLGEVVERAISSSSEKAMSERGLKPALRPKIEVTSFKKGTDLEFKLEVEVLPKIEPADFSTLKLERLVADVPDSEIDTALERLASQHKKSEAAVAGRKAQAGDVAVIDFKGYVDGTAFPGGEAEGHYLELGSNQFIPGFEDQLIGLEAGQSKTVKLTFPQDYAAKHLAGKEASFEVALKELRAPVKSAIDDQLAKDMGLADLAALRKTMRERIESEYSGVSKQRMKRALLDQLAAGHDFPVPPGMVELEFDAIWKQIKESKKRGDLDPVEAAKSDDELKADYRGIAERRVRLGLLLSEIGQRNNISVPPDELNRAMLEEARRFPGQERQVLEYFKSAPEAVAQLRAPLYEAKVVDFIVAVAKPAERKVSVEELVKEPDEDATDGPADAPAKKTGKGAGRKKGASKD